MSSGDAADASAPAPRMQPVTITLPSVDVRMLTSQFDVCHREEGY
jgi:hypothetical protein